MSWSQETLDAVAARLAADELAGALPAVAKLLGSEVPLFRMGLALCEADQPWLRVLEAVGHSGGPAQGAGARMPLEGTANGAAVASGEPIISWRLPAGRDYPEVRRLLQAGAAAYVCQPLSTGRERVGTLNLALREIPSDEAAFLAAVQRVARLLAMTVERDRLQAELRQLREALRERSSQPNGSGSGDTDLEPVAESPAARRTLRDIERVAVTDAHVLLTGPTGSGKEVLARYLHRMSPRSAGPFVVINCAALPESLAESELFGHRRGAFTGAASDHRGLFERASGGTLFLDEVGELSDRSQARLLRALQERAITPLGAERAVAADARIVAATNRDLMAMVRDQQFRLDLYHRLIAFPILVPALAERKDDIPELVRRFLADACQRMGRQPPEIPEGVMQALVWRDYPGNVRELRHLVERSLLCSSDRLQLPAEELPAVVTTSPADADQWPTLEEVQRQHIEATLRHTGGKFYGAGGAAELLDLAPSTLKSRMERFGLWQRHVAANMTDQLPRESNNRGRALSAHSAP